MSKKFILNVQLYWHVNSTFALTKELFNGEMLLHI